MYVSVSVSISELELVLSQGYFPPMVLQEKNTLYYYNFSQ